MDIRFHYQKRAYQIRDAGYVKNWLRAAVLSEKRTIISIDYFIISDQALREINEEFLNKNYYTDVISFNYSESELLKGEIYVSFDKVFANSRKYKVAFSLELLRVMLHGLLHILGFNDDTEASKAIMTQKEDYYLERYWF